MHDNAGLPIGLVFSYGVRPGDHGQLDNAPTTDSPSSFQVFGYRKRLSGKCLASDAEVNKLSAPGCIHLMPDFSTLVYKTWCHGLADASVSIMATSKTDL